MDLKSIYERLDEVGRTSARVPKPRAEKIPLSAVEKFKIQLKQQIDLLDGPMPKKSSKSRWVTQVDGALSVRFGSPAIPVGPKGNLYFKADTPEKAKEILSMGEALLEDKKFLNFVEHPDTRPSKRKSAEAEPAPAEKPKRAYKRKAKAS